MFELLVILFTIKLYARKYIFKFLQHFFTFIELHVDPDLSRCPDCVFNLLQFCRHYQSVLSSLVMITSAILFRFISYGNKEGMLLSF